MAAQARMVEAQQNIERNRATAASVAQNLQGAQTLAQQMTDNLNVVAVGATSPDFTARMIYGLWFYSHQDFYVFLVGHGALRATVGRSVFVC